MRWLTCGNCHYENPEDRPVNPFETTYPADPDFYPACSPECYSEAADELAEYLAELWASFTIPATCPIWLDFGQAYQPMLI